MKRGYLYDYFIRNNLYRPHSSLNDLTPEVFYQQHQKSGNLEFTGV